MADKKITQLNNITGANLVDADEFVVVDISADETKAITLGELKEAFDAGSGFVRVTGDTMTGPLDVQSTITADGLTVDGGVNIDTAVPILRLDSPAAAWAGGEDLGGLDWYTKDTSGNGPAVMARIYSESSGANTLPIPNIIFQTSVVGASLKDRLKIAGTGDISFYEDTGTTPKFFWDASAESLGIGTTTPDVKLEVRTITNIDRSEIEGLLRLTGRSSNEYGALIPSAGTALEFYNSWSGSNPNSVARISGRAEQGYNGGLQFDVSDNTGAGQTNFTTAMNILSNGNVLVGTTGLGGGRFQVLSPSGTNNMALFRTSTSFGNIIFQNSAGAQVGYIQSSASSTAYVTSSDYRLKTDAQPMTGASARVQALNPVNFEWISSGDRVDGFLAHEAQEVVPEAVTGTKDAMMDEEYEVTPAVLDDDGSETTAAVMGTRSVPDYQGIDQSKLVPLLTAALQEALTKIDALETRITALEG